MGQFAGEWHMGIKWMFIYQKQLCIGQCLNVHFNSGLSSDSGWVKVLYLRKLNAENEWGLRESKWGHFYEDYKKYKRSWVGNTNILQKKMPCFFRWVSSEASVTQGRHVWPHYLKIYLKIQLIKWKGLYHKIIRLQIQQARTTTSWMSESQQ